MFGGINYNDFDPKYQEARAEGFKIAESYLKEISKKFYKQMKKGLLEGMATTNTISFPPHKCNCEFCDLN